MPQGRAVYEASGVNLAFCCHGGAWLEVCASCVRIIARMKFVSLGERMIVKRHSRVENETIAA
ncbi:hypothetical protein BSU04_04875 [Caballeronia sordidicola]|uniref:Uncharacterized protein n=1 Tax=Caballeronia sordidicola TaxID=196367 RepID=A0A226X8R3_CABSO|nr:hypothetical protein BSU04_04875 [Caballeronia sordidicola]